MRPALFEIARHPHRMRLPLGEGEARTQIKEWRRNRANVVKLAGNFLLGAAVEGMAEASAMASRYGVTPADLLNVLTNGVFTAPSYQLYGDAIANERYEPPGFRLSLTLKDLRLALAAAEQVAVPMPLADVVHESLLEAVARGDGDRDLAALAKVSMLRAGVDSGLH